jgi:hypothetical protein
VKYFAASLVFSDGADEEHIVAQHAQVRSEIKGCSAQEFLLADDIPKNLTDTDDVHCVPPSVRSAGEPPGEWHGNRFVQQVNVSAGGLAAKWRSSRGQGESCSKNGTKPKEFSQKHLARGRTMLRS